MYMMVSGADCCFRDSPSFSVCDLFSFLDYDLFSLPDCDLSPQLNLNFFAFLDSRLSACWLLVQTRVSTVGSLFKFVSFFRLVLSYR